MASPVGELKFEGYPLYVDDGNDTVLGKGQVSYKLLHVKPSPTRSKEVPFPPGDLEEIRWEITATELWWPGKDAKKPREAAVTMEDLHRWIRGKHGYDIEADLRKKWRASVKYQEIV